MSWLDKRLGEINSRRFPENDAGLLRLVTNALVDRGYERFRVQWHDETGEHSWVVWAKSEQAVHDARPELALVIERMPLGWFYAAKTIAGGTGSMIGDVVLYEEADDVDSRTAETATAWLACPPHLRATLFPAGAA